MGKVSLYETDFVKWAEEQAALLTERHFDLLDLDNLIEEVDDLAGRHRDALQSHLRVLMIHMLKLVYATGSRDTEQAWKHSIRNARKAIRRLIDNYPSLSTHLKPLSKKAYQYATEDAHDELSDYGDEHEPFPEASPWTLEAFSIMSFGRAKSPSMSAESIEAAVVITRSRRRKELIEQMA